MLSPTVASPASERLAAIFCEPDQDSSVLIAHGYGVRVGLWNGHLDIKDGIGRIRRTRKIPKADRTVKRLIITGQEGYITLGALRWCQDHGLSILTIGRDGEPVSTHPADSPKSVKLLRAQALAGPDGPLVDKGIEVSRYLLTAKLRGQAANLVKLFGSSRLSDRIEHYASLLPDATTYEELNGIERETANLYFLVWQQSKVAVPWPESELDAIPANWLTFGRRKTNTSNQNAADPVNAMLNYAYSIGYGESRLACIGQALNPSLGFLHSDSDKRDSMALDILEAVRPDIDAHVLALLGYGSEPYMFTRRLFHEPRELSHGTLRLLAPLTHEIARESATWHEQLARGARDVAGILGAPIGKTGRRALNLKQQRTEFLNKPIDLDAILPVKTWESLHSILPPEKTHPLGGFPPISSRNVLAAMIYLEHHHKPWAHLPAAFGVSKRTMTQRRQEWKLSGAWDEIWSWVLDQAAKPM